MATEKQIAANRRNSKHSTGPRNTDQTKHNAVKHGLSAEGITGLDQAQYEEYRQRLIAEWNPVGAVETYLVQKMALLMVRLDRAGQLDCGFWQWRLQKDRARLALDGTQDVLAELPPAPASHAKRDEGHGAPRHITVRDLRVLNDTVARYETALENKLFRMIHELQRLQGKRRGEVVPVPVAADLNIHHSALPSENPGQSASLDAIEAKTIDKPK
jgi:hypothetical protein